jgi:hypothetical protein
MDRRGREYLKTAKPAFISDIDRVEGGRAGRRLEQRAEIKKAKWRKLRKFLGADRTISFRKRIALIRHSQEGA